ncbi:MAG: hypothetical protein AAGC53_11710 [Actinomycetota bacterium]
MATPYRNRQVGWGYLIPLLVILIPFAVASGQWVLGIIVTIVMTIVYGSFATLNTVVDRGQVRVTFTGPWPRRSIPVSSIRQHEVVRNRWWHGWGIRRIPGGWMYSVWGLDAVEILYRDPKKGRDVLFRVGTNDAEGLADAITAARSNHR